MRDERRREVLMALDVAVCALRPRTEQRAALLPNEARALDAARTRVERLRGMVRGPEPATSTA